MDDRITTNDYVFKYESKIISWCLKKQKTIALSLAKAEYIAVIAMACEVLYLRRILANIQLETEWTTSLFC